MLPSFLFGGPAWPRCLFYVISLGDSPATRSGVVVLTQQKQLLFLSFGYNKNKGTSLAIPCH